MGDLEKIYADKKSWITYIGYDHKERIGVYLHCPECGKYLKKGELLMTLAGEIKVRGWICRIHGEVEPYYDRW